MYIYIYIYVNYKYVQNITFSLNRSFLSQKSNCFQTFYIQSVSWVKTFSQRLKFMQPDFGFHPSRIFYVIMTHRDMSSDFFVTRMRWTWSSSTCSRSRWIFFLTNFRSGSPVGRSSAWHFSDAVSLERNAAWLECYRHVHIENIYNIYTHTCRITRVITWYTLI